jgi:hypothetical protein
MTGDTCPECGQALPGAARDDDCLCGDPEAIHHKTSGGNVTYCTRLSCHCGAYAPVVTP